MEKHFLIVEKIVFFCGVQNAFCLNIPTKVCPKRLRRLIIRGLWCLKRSIWWFCTKNAPLLSRFLDTTRCRRMGFSLRKSEVREN